MRKYLKIPGRRFVLTKRMIEDNGNESRMEIIDSTPTGGISGWVASQVADRLEARSKKKE